VSCLMAASVTVSQYMFMYASPARPPHHCIPTRRSSDLPLTGVQFGHPPVDLLLRQLHVERPLARIDDDHVAVAHRRDRPAPGSQDRQSTRLNSSHAKTSYAVSCSTKKSEGVWSTFGSYT